MAKPNVTNGTTKSVSTAMSYVQQLQELAALEAQLKAQIEAKKASMAEQRDTASSELKADIEADITKLNDNVVTMLATVNGKIETLNSLGFHFGNLKAFTPFALGTGGRDIKKRTSNPDGVKHCDLCGIDGHDARSHRNQPEPKRAFTSEELTAKSFVVPDGYVPPVAPLVTPASVLLPSAATA